MKSSLRNRLSDTKVIIIDEISMVSNNLLCYIYIKLNEIFDLVIYEPFPGLAVIALRDFLNCHQ